MSQMNNEKKFIRNENINTETKLSKTIRDESQQGKNKKQNGCNTQKNIRIKGGVNKKFWFQQSGTTTTSLNR